MSLELSRLCSAISPSPTLAIDAKAKEMAANGRDVVSFCAGEPDFVTPQYIRTAAHEALDMGLTKYTPAAGTLALRQAICDKLLCDNALSYTPSQIVVSNGAKFSIYASLCALLNPGDEVIIPTPCWVSYPEMVRLAGGVPVLVEGKRENNYVTEARDLAPYVTEKTKVLLINTPGNPTGAVWKREQLREIAKLAVARKFYVISDEIYEKLIYDGEQHTSIASFGEAIYNQTIVINGVSKAYAMTGWRLGYALGPKEIIQAMTKLHQFAIMSAPTTAQYAAIKALRDGDPDIERMRIQYDMRRRFVVAEFRRMGISCFEPEGAFYVFPCIKGTGLSSEEFCEKLLLEEHIAVIPGTAFGACGEGFVRVSYSYSLSHLREALMRMEKFLHKLMLR